MAKHLVKDNAVGFLAAPLPIGQPFFSVNVGAGALFPSPNPGENFYFTLQDPLDPAIREVCICSELGNDDFIDVSRAQSGTVQRDWPAGTLVELRLVAAVVEDLGVPSGGADTEVLAKASSADYVLGWRPAHYVPAGGAAADVLTKTSGTDFAVAFATPQYIPSGGLNGQALMKASDTDFDAVWSEPRGVLDHAFSTVFPTVGGGYAGFGGMTALTGNGNTGAFEQNPATCLLSSFGMHSIISQAANNVVAVWRCLDAPAKLFCTISGGISSGFAVSWKIRYTAASSTRRLFFGAAVDDTTVNNGNNDPSSAFNMVGIGKDSADSNLYFMWNDGSGAATKVDSGIAVSAIVDKSIQVIVSVGRNGVGTVMAIRDLETDAYIMTPTDVGMATNKPAVDVVLVPIAGANSGPSAGGIPVEVDVSHLTITKHPWLLLT